MENTVIKYCSGILAIILSLLAFEMTLKALILMPLLYLLLLGVFQPSSLEKTTQPIFKGLYRSNSFIRYSINGIMIATPAAILVLSGMTPWGWCVGSIAAGIIYTKV